MVSVGCAVRQHKLISNCHCALSINIQRATTGTRFRRWFALPRPLLISAVPAGGARCRGWCLVRCSYSAMSLLARFECSAVRFWRMSGFAFSRNGLGIWPRWTTSSVRKRHHCDPTKLTFAIALPLEQARTRRECLLLQKNTLQPPIVVPEF